MFKKFVVFVVIVFFVSCGSKQNVVRTTKSNSVPTKTVVRTVKKPAKSQITKPIVKNTTAIPKQTESSKSVTKPETKTVDVVKEPNLDTNDQQAVDLKQDNSQIEILEATTRVKVTTAMVLDYIEKYRGIAIEDMREYGIPASIILGQGILESGAGTGPLSAQANNHFGIKCHKEWNGPSVRYNDDVENECFRKYNDPKESYKDHSLFLITRAHYSSLFQLDKTDYKGWARGLKNAGYATDPAYPTKLIGIIERYNLQRFDYEVLGKDYVPNNVDVQVSSNNNKNAVSQIHQVSKGDTLYSISRKYNVTVQDLKKKNNISNDTLSVGQSLIIN